jgi:hypothetical protein
MAKKETVTAPEETTTTVAPEETTATVAQEETPEIVSEEETATVAQEEPDEMTAFIALYRKSYPKENVFHVTSDWQVFLGHDLQYAKTHQKQVDANRQVTTLHV